MFDGYDESGDGKISLSEFSASLQKNKAQVRAGVPTTLAERQAAQGISIADVGESVFHEMDRDVRCLQGRGWGWGERGWGWGWGWGGGGWDGGLGWLSRGTRRGVARRSRSGSRRA